MRCTLAAWLVGCLLCSTVIAFSAQAQDLTDAYPDYVIDARGLSLSEALDRFIKLAGIDAVFDVDLIEGKTTSCRYMGGSVDEALACLLAGSGLEANRLPSGAYILVENRQREPVFGGLTGRVVDGASGEPLVNAHVLLPSADTGEVTNSAGRFAFAKLPPGSYRIAVTYIGYQDLVDTVQVAPGENTRIELGVDVEPLVTSPIVVNGLVRRLPSEELESDSVDIAEVRQTGTGDVIRSVNTVIGIRVGDAMSEVHVQGGSAGEHQYRLDGAPVFVPIPNGGLVGPFSAFALDKFTVHKAGFGASHGSSLSGIIEVDHRLSSIVGNQYDIQVDPLSVNGRATGSLGDRNRFGINWMAAVRKGIWSLYQMPALSNHFNQWSAPDLFLLKALSPIKDQKEYTDHQEFNSRVGLAPLNEEARNVLASESFQDSFDFFDLHAAMRVHVGLLRSIHMSLYRGGNQLGDKEVVMAGTQPWMPSDSRDNLLTMNSSHRWSNAVSQLRYEHVMGARTFAEWSVWYSEFDLNQNMDQVEYDQEMLGVGASIPSFEERFPNESGSIASDSIPKYKTDDQNSIAELGFKGEVSHSTGANHYVTAGIEVIQAESSFLLNFQSPFRGPERESSFAELSSSHWRWSAYIEDTIQFSEQTLVSAGIRLTYLDNHSTVYAEPRLSFRHDAREGVFGPWAFRAAIGLYRQYINQFDVASLNINAVLPSVRFWLPLEGDVNPSRALHTSAAFLLMPDPSWRLRLEGYYKRQPHTLVIDYERATRYDGSLNGLDTQSDLLIGADGFAYGGAISLEKKTKKVTASAQYEYSVARQRIPNRFDGAFLSVPWNVPHHVTTSFDVALNPNLTFIGRLENSIGRTWAYRDAYYNFLQPVESFNEFGQYDLSDPTSHRLPMITKLDLGISYTSAIQSTRIQIRMDFANVLSSSNVEEWILVHDSTTNSFRRVERPLTPFLPSVTVRVGW